MNEPKFKVDDRVACTDNGELGVITLVDDKDDYSIYYEVQFDNGEETWIEEDMLELSDEPPYDPKKAFLTELKELLDFYNATIPMRANEPITIDGEDISFDELDEVFHCIPKLR